MFSTIKFHKTDGGYAKTKLGDITLETRGDCGIRAIAVATDLPYSVVYNRLFRLQTAWSKNNAFAKQPIVQSLYDQVLVSYINRYIPNYERLELDSWLDIPHKGTFIVKCSDSSAGHLSCVKDLVFYDNLIPLHFTISYGLKVGDIPEACCKLCKSKKRKKLYYVSKSDLPPSADDIKFKPGRWFCKRCLRTTGKTRYIHKHNRYDKGEKKR